MTITHIHGLATDFWDVEFLNHVAVEHNLGEAINRCLYPQRGPAITTQKGGAKLVGKDDWTYGQN